MADVALEQRAARRADASGIAALWARDVPVAIPQGSDGEAALLHDPFLWLSALASVTRDVALGTAAAVLPLRHPLHLAKSALSLDDLTGGRFILGLGSGDREQEFQAFHQDVARRADLFRERWTLVRAALSPVADERKVLLEATGGHDIFSVPAARVPMMVVGSARQSLQWIATHADAWATYHREEVRQAGRMGLWRSALAERDQDPAKPFVQSLHLQLLENPDAPAEAIELGLRTGRKALVGYLRRLEEGGVAHVLFHLARGPRPVLDIVEELGQDGHPALLALGPSTWNVRS
jgi:luciferase-type oxidoreductase